MTDKLRDKNFLTSAQYAKPQNLLARKALTDYQFPKLDFRRKAVDALHLKGTESILDAGCGNGDILIRLRDEWHHRGRLVGLDISPGMFEQALLKGKVMQPPIEFLEGSADELPFDDETFNVVFAINMIYHTPDIEKTLKELNRVLKPNGMLLVTTISINARPKFHRFKKAVAEKIGKKAPGQFVEPFSLENAEEQIKRIFSIKDKFVYEAEIHLTESEPYIALLDSIRDSWEGKPTDEEWTVAKELVRNLIQEELKERGLFVDHWKTGYFICVKSL